MNNTKENQIIRPLPTDISNIILEFAGYHKFRTGKYINQLDKSKEIFKLLELKKPIINGYVELFIKCIKRKQYCDHKIKIYYNEFINSHCIKYALDEYDYDDSVHEVCIYDLYVC